MKKILSIIIVATLLTACFSTFTSAAGTCSVIMDATPAYKGQNITLTLTVNWNFDEPTIINPALNYYCYYDHTQLEYVPGYLGATGVVDPRNGATPNGYYMNVYVDDWYNSDWELDGQRGYIEGGVFECLNNGAGVDSTTQIFMNFKILADAGTEIAIELDDIRFAESRDINGVKVSTVHYLPGYSTEENAKNYFKIPVLEAPADIPLPTLTADVLGAQIKTSEPAGLRFAATIDTTSVDWANVTDYGFKIVYYRTIVDVPAKINFAEEAGKITFTAVITNIPTTKLDKNFTAVAYINFKNGDSTWTTTDTPCVRNYNQVLTAADIALD